MAKRFRIVAVLEGDLDALPGTCHQETDWQQFAFREFLAQTHYNTSVTILESTDHRDVMGGHASIFDGWVEYDEPTIPADLTPDTLVQIRTVGVPSGDLNNWYAAGEVWNAARQRLIQETRDGKAYIVTHYRVKRMARQ